MILFETNRYKNLEKKIDEKPGVRIGSVKQHALKLFIENYLIAKGYKTKHYGKNSVSYTNRQVLERKEPIEIDFGLIMDDKRVLSITIRDVNNGNRHLNDYVLQLLEENGINYPKNDPNEEGIIVYYLRR